MAMRILTQLTLGCCVLTACSGCLARQIGNDAIDLRAALLNMYSDQALDNLIRARNNMPFVQLSYSKLQVNDDNKLKSAVTGGAANFTYGHTANTTAASPLAQFTKLIMFAGAFPFSANDIGDRSLVFHADPVTNQNFIYEDYLQFVNTQGQFIDSDCPPTCPVHCMRKCGNRWYWIPIEARDAFLALVLKTAFGDDPTGPTIYWDTTIASSAARFDTNGQLITSAGTDADGHQVTVTSYAITLNDPVPYDDGVMFVTLKNGCKFELPVLKARLPQPTGPPTTALPTVTQIYTQSTEPLDGLEGSLVRLFLTTRPNTKPKTAPTPNIANTLESIRVNQTRNMPLSNP
jgi:hypothetical protein